MSLFAIPLCLLNDRTFQTPDVTQGFLVSSFKSTTFMKSSGLFVKPMECPFNCGYTACKYNTAVMMQLVTEMNANSIFAVTDSSTSASLSVECQLRTEREIHENQRLLSTVGKYTWKYIKHTFKNATWFIAREEEQNKEHSKYLFLM